ncbi:MAG: B12-binding domain-containing radical SAM protein [Chloroflexota bacterium]
MLFFPPNWTPSMPHLALPSLTAYLRQAGIETIQRDLNAEVFDALLQPGFMLRSLQRLQRQRPRPDGPPAEALAWAREQGPALVRSVGEAVAVIRSPAFYDGARSLPAFETVLGALRLASLPYFPASLELQSYQSAYRPDASASILRAVDDRARNMFIELFEELVLPDLRREDPDLVGISIPCINQVIAGFTLARLVKRAGLRAHVSIGGPMANIWREQLPQLPAMFQLIDSAVVFDGEEPLLQLCQALERGEPLATVPNLIYPDGDRIRTNPRQKQARIATVPAPDFDGLPLDRYLAPELVLPMAMARGCYFGKCAFCNVGFGEAEVFSQMQGDALLEQMQSLCARHGSRRIFFVDEAMPPRLIRHIAPRLEELGTPIQWGGCMRFEKVINRDFLETAHAGGCCMMLFGLESAAQRVMDFMIKGTQMEHVARILLESHDAGIWNHTFFFFGFPGETMEDAQETANFLYRNGELINSAALGTFLLERYAPAHGAPKTFGISRVIEDPAADLGFYFDYEVASGIDAATAEMVAHGFEEALPRKAFPQFYVSDVYRFLYAAHLSEQAIALPPWIPDTVLAAS